MCCISNILLSFPPLFPNFFLFVSFYSQIWSFFLLFIPSCPISSSYSQMWSVPVDPNYLINRLSGLHLHLTGRRVYTVRYFRLDAQQDGSSENTDQNCFFLIYTSRWRKMCLKCIHYNKHYTYIKIPKYQISITFRQSRFTKKRALFAFKVVW